MLTGEWYEFSDRKCKGLYRQRKMQVAASIQSGESRDVALPHSPEAAAAEMGSSHHPCQPTTEAQVLTVQLLSESDHVKALFLVTATQNQQLRL